MFTASRKKVPMASKQQSDPEPESGGLTVILWLAATLLAMYDLVVWIFDRIYSQ
jgi:hypothetical protein